MAMVLTRQKPIQRKRFVVSFPRVCRGPRRAWEAWREASGTWETLGVPACREAWAGDTETEPRSGETLDTR
jgi:hypothetical protein